MQISENEKIEDLMIGGMKIIQSDSLYRFTSDATLLSRFAVSKKGENVADICSGSGIVGLHYFALHRDFVKAMSLFELQTPLAEMSARSVELNGLNDKISVYNTAIQQISSEHFGKYNLVLCNPPYKKSSSGMTNEENHIAICRHEITVSLDEIVECASKLLTRGGRFCMCHKCERLNDVICALNNHSLTPTRLRFLSGTVDSAPYLFFIESAKDVKPQLKVEKLLTNNAKDFSGNCN